MLLHFTRNFFIALESIRIGLINGFGSFDE
jgi:hypothetical protein